MRRRVCTGLSLLCAVAAAFLLPELLRLPHTATHHWLYALGAAGVFAMGRVLLLQNEKRLCRYALGLGFAFALCQLAGARLDAADTLGGGRAFAALLACALSLAPAAGAGFAWLARRAEEIRPSEGEYRLGGRVFWGCLAAILLAWLPMVLAYYPGMFNYDSTGEITQVLAHSYDGNFPIAHTLLLGAFYRLGEALGSYNTGIALYTALQCAALAASMAYAALYLYRLGCPRWLWLGMTALFALLPTHSLLAMCTTKDLFFSAALLVLMLRLHAFWRAPEAARGRDFAIIAVLTALLCLMRNNGVLAILAAALGALPALAAHRRSRRRLLAALLCGVVLFGAATAGLNAVTRPKHGDAYEWLEVVHTLLWGAFYRLGEAMGSYRTGLALYTALQIAAVVALTAYAALYLYRLGRCPRWLWLGLTALFVLLPASSLASTDVLIFVAPLVLVLVLRLHAFWRAPEAARGRDFVIIAALTVLLCLLYKNSVLAVLAAALGALPALAAHRRSRRRLLAALLGGVVLFGAATAGLSAIAQPRRAGIREWLSVPLMQVARVWAKAEEAGETLPEDAEIRAFIPQVECYQRHLSDGVKRKTTVGVVNMPQFLSLWGRLFAQYPADFVDAAAYLTKGYWHLNDETHLDIYAERGNHGYLETVNQDGLGVTRQSVLPGLMERMDALFVENEYRRVPLLATVVEPAFWCWMVCALVVWMAYRRDRGGLWAASPLVGLFASMLFGPCAYIRYAYPLALCAPALLGLGWARGDEVGLRPTPRQGTKSPAPRFLGLRPKG